MTNNHDIASEMREEWGRKAEQEHNVVIIPSFEVDVNKTTFSSQFFEGNVDRRDCHVGGKRSKAELISDMLESAIMGISKPRMYIVCRMGGSSVDENLNYCLAQGFIEETVNRDRPDIQAPRGMRNYAENSVHATYKPVAMYYTTVAGKRFLSIVREMQRMMVNEKALKKAEIINQAQMQLWNGERFTPSEKAAIKAREEESERADTINAYTQS